MAALARPACANPALIHLRLHLGTQTLQEGRARCARASPFFRYYVSPRSYSGGGTRPTAPFRFALQLDP